MRMLLKNKSAVYWLLSCTALLCAGLLYSRALLSISSILIVLPLLLQLKEYKTWLAVAILLMGSVLVSLIWTSDVGLLWRSIEVKLPLLMIGLAFAAVSLNKQQLLQLIWVIHAFLLSAILYTLIQYAANPAAINASYQFAKVMPVPMDSDHIRLSWWMVLSMLALLYSVQQMASMQQRYLAYAVVVIETVFLHFLAAKTGLLALYLAAGVWIIQALLHKTYRRQAIQLLIFLIMLAVAAYAFLPTLQMRVQYVLYDLSNYSKGIFQQGSSDGARVLSWKAGWAIGSANPLLGVGFGDIRAAVDAWHQQYFPHTLPAERFLPTNQWLIYFAGAGILGVVGFTYGLILLLRQLSIRYLPAMLVLLLPLITDDSLEGQFGVVIFALSLAVFAQLSAADRTT
jgi:O-antigen ligase